MKIELIGHEEIEIEFPCYLDNSVSEIFRYTKFINQDELVTIIKKGNDSAVFECYYVNWKLVDMGSNFEEFFSLYKYSNQEEIKQKFDEALKEFTCQVWK